MNIDHLVRLKLAGQSQNMRNRTPFYHRHARSSRFWSGLDITVPTGALDEPCGESEDYACSKQENKTLSHCVPEPIGKLRNRIAVTQGSAHGGRGIFAAEQTGGGNLLDLSIDRF
jgi:hypothetical protein